MAAADALDGARSAFLRLLMLTGARPGEILYARREWRHGAVLRIPDGKTGARSVFLSPDAEAILDSLPYRADGFYFPQDMDVRRGWEKVLRIACIPKARVYDLRHTFASSALAAGAGLDTIGLLLGHRKRETTLRYAHLTPALAVETAAKAAAYMEG
jgi:integrase